MLGRERRQAADEIACFLGQHQHRGIDVAGQAVLADAEKGKMEIELVTGQELEEVIRQAYATPKPVVAMVQKAMGR
jgi:hypothetical protein